MGVLKFFRYLTQKYPDALIRLNGTYDNCDKANTKDIETDWLELDLNSIYHPVAQEYHQYGNKQPQESLLLKRKKKNNKPIIEKTEEKLFELIGIRLENIRKIFNPKKGIYFATDGVAGSSKIQQQRKRRFKGAGEKKDPKKFDSNCISCGTLFMDRLAKYIRNFIEEKLTTNLEWKHLSIIINDYTIVGEGEHKNIAHMRKNPNLSFTVVSPDADLIFLGLGLHNPKIYIFRENIFEDTEGSFFIVDLNTFRSCIIQEMKYNNEQLVINTDNEHIMIEDFIFMLFGVGNDFLPQIPSLDISNHGIENILYCYASVIYKHGFITKNINGSRTINKYSFKEFLKLLADKEHDMILNNKKKNSGNFPDELLNKCCIIQETADKSKQTLLDFTKYRNLYYDEKFKQISREIVVHEYLKGMTFVLRYYLDSIPSWTWMYPFIYAPFFQELYQYIDTFQENIDFGVTSPLTPLEQLLAILPGNSNTLLPEELRWLSTSIDSPIIDMFPIDFETDLQGKKYEYEGVSLLPNIDIDRLRETFKTVNLKEYDKERNKLGEVVMLYLENEDIIEEVLDV